MRCQNCGNTDWFVLVVELAISAYVPPEFDRTPGLAEPPTFTDPDWTLALECATCASTDVAGDPVALLAASTR